MIKNARGCFCGGFPNYVNQVLDTVYASDAVYYNTRSRGTAVIWVSHTTPLFYHRAFIGNSKPSYHIGRSMYEFNILPKVWHENLALVDEFWVPSGFVRDSFISSGVDPAKIIIIPEALDVDLYSPFMQERYPLPFANFTSQNNESTATNYEATEEQRSHYKFLSVFKWEMRKGWDILFKAYFQRFTAKDKVSLYIVTNIFGSRETDFRHARDAFAIRRWIFKLAAELKLTAAELPHFVVITAFLGENEVAALYRSCDAFVLPTRGEGWGLPAIQAMSSGLPTISTNYSGNVDFMSVANSYLIRIKGLELVPIDTPGMLDLDAGMVWGSPDPEHTGELMRHVFEHQAEARDMGKKAREHIAAHYSEDAIYDEHVAPRLRAVEALLRR